MKAPAEEMTESGRSLSCEHPEDEDHVNLPSS